MSLQLAEEIIKGRRLKRGEDLSFLLSEDLDELCAGADKIRKELCGNHVDLCSIINGRSGRCGEDCRYCAQAACHHTGIDEYGFLPKEEITALINGTFKKKSYELIRDLFIFCCFTGLSWRDMYNLTEENLQTSFDGHLWIKTNRQKTGVESNIRLLDVPKHIIEKYSGMAEDGRLLPVPCYGNCKNGIKAIAKLCGINKNVTWHCLSHSKIFY